MLFTITWGVSSIIVTFIGATVGSEKLLGVGAVATLMTCLFGS